MPRRRPEKHVTESRDRVFSEKKIKYFENAHHLFDTYDKCMVVLCDNVQSQQMQNIRFSLRGCAHILMGKNTLYRRILLDRSTQSEKGKIMYEKLVSDGLLVGNVGLIMSNGDLGEIKKIIDANQIQAPARQGAIAPLDVIVPAGNTGLEPTKTQFFQALNIMTKITKGTVEILKDEHVIKVGDKVGQSEAALLQMLNIKPFFYGIKIQHIYDNGSVYGTSVLEMTDDDMKAKIMVGISNLTAFSLGSGFTTKASIPHVISNTFQRALALTLVSDYTMQKGKGHELKEAILSGKLSASAAPAAAPAKGAAAEKPKVEAKAAEPEEEGDDDMGFGLFD